MKMIPEQRWKCAVRIVILLGLVLTCVFCIHGCRYKQKRKRLEADCASLRSVIAEAYINIKRDPEFVNTATKGNPMEIPDKYYTYVESEQGDGRVHVIMYYENTLSAYFGTPEKTVNYYLGYTLYDLPE